MRKKTDRTETSLYGMRSIVLGANVEYQRPHLVRHGCICRARMRWRMMGRGRRIFHDSDCGDSGALTATRSAIARDFRR